MKYERSLPDQIPYGARLLSWPTQIPFGEYWIGGLDKDGPMVEHHKSSSRAPKRDYYCLQFYPHWPYSQGSQGRKGLHTSYQHEESQYDYDEEQHDEVFFHCARGGWTISEFNDLGIRWTIMKGMHCLTNLHAYPESKSLTLLRGWSLAHLGGLDVCKYFSIQGMKYLSNIQYFPIVTSHSTWGFTLSLESR